MRFAFFCNSQFICIQLYGHESIIWVLTGFKLRMELELFPQWNEGVLSERKQPWVFRPRLLVPFFVPFNPFNFQAPRFVIDRPDTTGTFILENPYVKARWRDSCFFECEFSLVFPVPTENLDAFLQRKGMFLQTRVPWKNPFSQPRGSCRLLLELHLSLWRCRWVDEVDELIFQQKSLWKLLLAVGWRFHESAPYHLASWAEWARHYAGQGARVVKRRRTPGGLWDMIDLAYYRTNYPRFGD